MEIQFQTIGGCRYAYVNQGRGIPWVLIHGFPLSHRMWLPVIERIQGRVRAIAPDLRGFGQTEARGDRVTMADFADDIAALLDHLNIDEPVVICGLSMGGYIALEFWFRHPERVGGLVLCDTRAASDTPEVVRTRQETAQRVLQEGPGFLAETMIGRLLAPATLREHPEVAAELRQQIQQASPNGVAAAALGMAERRDMRPLLAQITCPTLVVVGSEDAISPPSEMRSIAEAIPDGQYVEIGQAGHMTPLENPDAVAEVFLQFLDRVGRPSK